MKHLRTWLALPLVVAAAMAAQSAIASAADEAAQVKVVSGGRAMTQAEVAQLQPAAIYAESVEGQPVANTVALHCYGAVKWKAGVNIVGITLWKEWNHTSWCGRRGVSV